MIGVYLHIPFCAKKCSYCDFHFSTNFESYRGAMISAMENEINLRAASCYGETLSTIYFGGGTPSLLTSHELEKLLLAVNKLGKIEADAEITLECNPDDCSLENLSAWKKLGINRLSLGIQSFNKEQLSWMNRTHNAQDSLLAIERAYACGFQVLTCDVIYGLPGMTLSELEFQLRTLIDFGINHLSAYCLTVEPRTALAKLVKDRAIEVSNNDEQAEQFLFLVDYLENQGFEQYEISNFAKNKAYSKHNTAYWQGKKYLGIGPSAHGFNGVERYWNIANNPQYINALKRSVLPEEREVLSKYDRFNEAILVGLRTQWGVSKALLAETGVELNTAWLEIWESFVKAGLCEENDLVFKLSKLGRLQADHIASELFILPH